MEKLFDLEEELVLFFAKHKDDFSYINHTYHHLFFDTLSASGFDVSNHTSLEVWEAVKSLRQKGYLSYTCLYSEFVMYSFRIKQDKCLSYLRLYERNHSLYGKFINHISQNSWFYGSLFGALVGSIFTVIIEKYLLKYF